MLFKKNKNSDTSPVGSLSEGVPFGEGTDGGADIPSAVPMDAEDIDLSSRGTLTSQSENTDDSGLSPIVITDAESAIPQGLPENGEIGEISDAVSEYVEIPLSETEALLSISDSPKEDGYASDGSAASVTSEPEALPPNGESDTDAASKSQSSCPTPAASDADEHSEHVITNAVEASADTEEKEDDDAEENGDEDEASTEEPLNDFEASLRDFSESDTDSEIKPTSGKFDIIRSVIFVACIVICAVSTMSLVRNIYDKIRGEQIYGEIINNVADGFNMDGSVENAGGKLDLLSGDKSLSYTPTMDEIIKNGITEVVTPTDHSAELARMRASLESLRNINPEIYAWIKIPGTNINYPVAQTDNNEYYLDHAYTGEDLVNGSIFADFRCQTPITNNYNTILYGHNITSGSMFNHVTKFFDEEVFNNTLIYLYTFDGIYVFKPFSIHEAAYDSGYVNVGFTPEEFVAFATELASLSDIPSDVEFVPSDSLLTLSTCTNGIATRRYALHAVLIEAITD